MSGREAGAISALVCLCALVYALIGLFQHWRFDTSYDLAIFNQAIWHMSRFEAPGSSIRGVSNLFADHFHPVLVLLAPLYRITPTPALLLAAQAVLFAVSLVPVFLFLRDRLPLGPSLSLCASCGLFWGLQRAATQGFHEIAFAPLVIATLILAMDRERWKLFWASAVALALVKEDLIPVLPFVAIYLVLRGERKRGVILLAASLIAFPIVVGIVIPAFGETGRYDYVPAYSGVLQRPWTIPAVLVHPPAKLMTLLLWLAPFAMLPLFSPLSVLIVPFVLTRFLSESPAHWGTVFHYSAPLAPILAMGAGDGLLRLTQWSGAPRRRGRLLTGLSAASLVLALFLPGNQPLWDLFEAEYYRLPPARSAGYEAIQRIPADASVVAQGAVLPHVSQRERAYLLQEGAPDADFIIASAAVNPWPLAGFPDVQHLLDQRLARGYVVAFNQQGWIVLRRARAGD